MNLLEYESVQHLTYREYCAYLRDKYGGALYPYMTYGGSRNPKVTRTKDGLLVHHIFEDHAIMLCNKNWAMKNPYEWQQPQNLVYCDYLEHLFLHILICEYPAKDKNVEECVGIGGAINFIVPELNDFYSGCEPKPEWRNICLNKIKSDKEVYLALLKRFKINCKGNKFYKPNCLYTSYTPNVNYCSWRREKNYKIFAEIAAL